VFLLSFLVMHTHPINQHTYTHCPNLRRKESRIASSAKSWTSTCCNTTNALAAAAPLPPPLAYSSTPLPPPTQTSTRTSKRPLKSRVCPSRTGEKEAVVEAAAEVFPTIPMETTLSILTRMIAETETETETEAEAQEVVVVEEGITEVV
jgi:hypothetical protein